MLMTLNSIDVDLLRTLRTSTHTEINGEVENKEMSNGSRGSTQKKIAVEVTTCQNCQLSYSRKLSVPGEGPADAEILLIGEGPGFYENEQDVLLLAQPGNF
jgi:hypothetical protein